MQTVSNKIAIYIFESGKSGFYSLTALYLS